VNFQSCESRAVEGLGGGALGWNRTSDTRFRKLLQAVGNSRDSGRKHSDVWVLASHRLAPIRAVSQRLADQMRTGKKRQFVEPFLMDRQVAIAKGIFEPTPRVARNAAFYSPDRAKRCHFDAVG
jgi:hypothetical protein